MAEGVDTLAKGLAENPLAWGLALALVAIAYLFRELQAARVEHAKELITTIRDNAKEQREILGQIVPLASKLTEGLELLERMTDAVGRE